MYSGKGTRRDHSLVLRGWFRVLSKSDFDVYIGLVASTLACALRWGPPEHRQVPSRGDVVVRSFDHQWWRSM